METNYFSHRLAELGFRPVYAVLTDDLTTAMTGLAGLLLWRKLGTGRVRLWCVL